MDVTVHSQGTWEKVVEWRKLFPHNWEPVKKIENKSVENSILMGGSGPGHFPHS